MWVSYAWCVLFCELLTVITFAGWSHYYFINYEAFASFKCYSFINKRKHTCYTGYCWITSVPCHVWLNMFSATQRFAHGWYHETCHTEVIILGLGFRESPTLVGLLCKYQWILLFWGLGCTTMGNRVAHGFREHSHSIHRHVFYHGLMDVYPMDGHVSSTLANRRWRARFVGLIFQEPELEKCVAGWEPMSQLGGIQTNHFQHFFMNKLTWKIVFHHNLRWLVFGFVFGVVSFSCGLSGCCGAAAVSVVSFM